MTETLKPGYVFKTNDKSGDLAGVYLYVKSSEDGEVEIILPDKTKAFAKETDLNVDQKSIEKYNPKIHPKFV